MTVLADLITLVAVVWTLGLPIGLCILFVGER